MKAVSGEGRGGAGRAGQLDGRTGWQTGPWEGKGGEAGLTAGERVGGAM